MKQKTLIISVALLLLLTFGAIALYATSGDKAQTVRMNQENPIAGNTVQMTIKPVPTQPATGSGAVPYSNNRSPYQASQGTNRIQQVNGTQTELTYTGGQDSSESSAPFGFH